MKFGHAAALALVGWYLMVPRLGYNPRTGWTTCCFFVRDEAPDVSSLDTVGSYDTATQCEDDRVRIDPKKWAAGVGIEAAKRDPESLKRATEDAAKQAVCIATDDPRLKKR